MNLVSANRPDQPLHIEVVTDTYVPDINGVALSLGRLCAGLRERGHRVEVIRSGSAAGEGGEWVPWWPLPGYWEIRVGAPWPGQLRRRWRKQRPDVIYVAIETPLGFSAASAALKLGIPVIGGFHTNFREYLRKYGMARISEKVWLYQKWFHDRLALTLVPSPDARDKLSRAGFSKIGVLGRGVDAELFHPQKRSAALRAEWGARDETPVALVVGRVSSEKNIELAIRAFDRMRRSCPEVICVVVGDGPIRNRLERENPDLRFTGYQTGADLAACYASADVLLFPSETETFGNVLLEGMAAGVATLAYDYAAAAWHCVDGVNGLKVRKSDEAAFLTAAESLMDAPLRARLGREARRTAEGLAWPAIVGELEEIFRGVIERPSGR
jgi:glycosyltransferase involved in cell wall biosynthesis